MPARNEPRVRLRNGGRMLALRSGSVRRKRRSPEKRWLRVDGLYWLEGALFTAISRLELQNESRESPVRTREYSTGIPS
jgi:hypothetical protein